MLQFMVIRKSKELSYPFTRYLASRVLKIDGSLWNRSDTIYGYCTIAIKRFIEHPFFDLKFQLEFQFHLNGEGRAVSVTAEGQFLAYWVRP